MIGYNRKTPRRNIASNAEYTYIVSCKIMSEYVKNEMFHFEITFLNITIHS